MTSETLIYENDLPDCETLLTILSRSSNLTFKYSIIGFDYLDRIIGCLDDYVVLHFPQDSLIHIQPGISTSKIIQKANDIRLCAISFRKDAIDLMLLMSKTFSIDLETLDGLGELKSKLNGRLVGRLNKDWTFHFHGSGCLFLNELTHQEVEVVIITRPDYSCFNGYSFYKYISTTARLKYLDDWFQSDSGNVYKALDILTKEGFLRKKKDVGLHMNLFSV